MNITTGNTTTINFGDPRKVLIGRLFKEDKITIDEMLLLLGQSDQVQQYPTYPQIQPSPQPWWSQPNPFTITSKQDTPFTLTGTHTYIGPMLGTVTNTTLKN